MVALFCRHGLAESTATAFVQRGNAYKTGVWPQPMTYRQLFAGDRLQIGNQEWRTIVGYGHAAEHMSLYCDELRVLISGDMLLPRISTNIAVQALNPDGDPLRLFLASIDAFLELPADTLVLPAHGRPFRGIHDRVAQLHAHHVERCNVLLRACKGKAASAAELIPVLFERQFDDIHQTMFAMGEAIAHLNYLWHAGRLRRTQKNGVLHFSS
jgi:glyoxylase-like metal-dependent hydrolase (beta-lactamase superfamily II)